MVLLQFDKEAGLITVELDFTLEDYISLVFLIVIVSSLEFEVLF